MTPLSCLPKASQTVQLISFHRQWFHKVLQEIEKYCKLNADIRNQAKAKVKEIMKEQQEEFFEQGRKEGNEDFSRKTANTSGAQGVNAI